MPYRTLRADCVVETIDKLVLRIGERFPESGLRRVAVDLGDIARRCASEALRLSRPQRWIRAMTASTCKQRASFSFSNPR